MRVWWAIAAAILAGCDGGEAGADRVAAILALEGDPEAGAEVFSANCAVCHGADAMGGTGPALAGYPSGETLVQTVLEGGETMTPFAEVLSDQEIADVLAYVQSL